MAVSFVRGNGDRTLRPEAVDDTLGSRAAHQLGASDLHFDTVQTLGGRRHRGPTPS
jgi:hypothetical protein